MTEHTADEKVLARVAAAILLADLDRSDIQWLTALYRRASDAESAVTAERERIRTTPLGRFDGTIASGAAAEITDDTDRWQRGWRAACRAVAGLLAGPS